MADFSRTKSTELAIEEGSPFPSKTLPLRNNGCDLSDVELQVIYSAINIIKIVIPVFMCNTIVVISMNLTDYFNDSGLRDLIFKELVTDSLVSSEWMAVVAGLAVMIIAATTTSLFILLFKNRCYKIMDGWVMCAILGELTLFSALYLRVLLNAYDIAPSSLTVWFCLYNSGALGMMSFYWIGPFKLQQFYLILMSVQAALVCIKLLSDTVVWSILTVVSFIWDPIAALCPRGPLRVLMETSKEMNESLPSAMMYCSEPFQLVSLEGWMVSHPQILADNEATEEESKPHRESEAKQVPAKTSQRTTESVPFAQNLRRRQVKADQAALPPRTLSPNKPDSNNNDVVNDKEKAQQEARLEDVACYLAILVGLGFTFALLSVSNRPLPALPIPIFGGMLFSISSCFCIGPYVAEISKLQLLY